MDARQRLRFVDGYGIEEDCNASRISPRQVLIASREVYQDLNLPPHALRENVLVSGDPCKLSAGQVIKLGDAVALWITMPCEPCAKLNEIRDGLAKQVSDRRGYLSRVIEGGTIALGDSVTITEESVPPLPESPRERVYELIGSIPSGRVITFNQIVQTMGLTSSYVRVIPRYIKNSTDDTPCYRVVSDGLKLIESHIPNQKELLESENVDISNNQVSDEFFRWDTRNFFVF